MTDSNLTPWVRQKLASSALSPEVIQMLLTPHPRGGIPFAEEPPRRGSKADSRGISLPYWTPEGRQVRVIPHGEAGGAAPVDFTRLRLSDHLIKERTKLRQAIVPGLPPELQAPKKEYPRYLSPPGSGVQVYHSHIAILASSDRYAQRLNSIHTTLRIVEGEFKSESLTIHDPKAVTIALGGVWNWRVRGDDGESHVLPELSGGEGAIPLKGREVRLCFDSDTAHNPKVQAALKALALHLHSLGARVFHEVLPTEPINPAKPSENGKNGPDDLIYRHGPEAFQRIRNQPQVAVEVVSVGSGKNARDEVVYRAPEEPDATNASHSRAQSLLAVTARRWAGGGNGPTHRWTGTCWETLYGADGEAAVQSLSHRFRIAQGWVHCDGKTISSWMQEWRRGLPTGIPRLPAHLRTSGVVPCSNGLLRLDTMELVPHDPAHGNTWCLQIPYDPAAPQGRVVELLIQILGVDGCRQVMAATAAAIKGTIGHHKLILEVFGPGDCGKSLVALIIQAVLGLSNTASGTLERLENRGNRFETSRFDGARLAVFNEAQRYSGPLENLKAMTGRDLVPAERKGGVLYEFTFSGLVALIGNGPINAQDHSDALLNRLLRIGPLRPIPKGQQDPGLLFVNHETGDLQGSLVPHLPGFLLELLALSDHDIREALSTQTRTDEQIANEVKALTEYSPVLRFVDDHLIFDQSIERKDWLSTGTWGFGDPVPSSSDEKLFRRFVALCLSPSPEVEGVPSGDMPRILKDFRSRIVSTLRDQLHLPLPPGDTKSGLYKVRDKGMVIPYLRWRTPEERLAQEKGGGPLLLGPISMAVTLRRRPHTPSGDDPCRTREGLVKTKTLAGAECEECEGLLRLGLCEEEKKVSPHMKASVKSPSHPSRPSPTGVWSSRTLHEPFTQGVELSEKPGVSTASDPGQTLVPGMDLASTLTSNNQMEATSNDPRDPLLADLDALKPWQQRVIRLKVMDPAALPAALINQIPPEELPHGTGAMVKAFLAEPNIIELVARLSEHKPQHGEAA